MASNEPTETELNSPTTPTTTTTPPTTMPSENIGEDISEAVASSQRRRSAAYRGVHFASVPEENEEGEEEDLWWREVESAEFTLDHVPHVTSVFTPSPEDILEQPTSPEEALTAIYDEEFERLHRLTTRIKNTMEEQRVRHFSESSQDNENHNKLETEEVLSSSPQTAEGASALAAPKEQSLEEFKEELRLKRQTRQSAIQGLRDEISLLRKQLETERNISRRLRNGEKVEESPPLEKSPKSPFTSDLEGATALTKRTTKYELLDDDANGDDDANPLARSRHANIELANAQLALQMANSENLSLRGELDIVHKQVASLKDVIACCKQMLTVKEEQCNEVIIEMLNKAIKRL